MKPRWERPTKGPSFAGLGLRTRIAGALGPAAPRIVQAIEQEFGEGCKVLPREALVVDADACTLDGRPIESPEDWWKVVRDAAFHRVEGAFVLGFISNGLLSIARDPIGHRSLYYTVCEGTFVFASTIRAVLDAARSPRIVDLRSVAAYLTYAYVPGQATLVRDVYELMPGEVVCYDGKALRHKRFWDLPKEPEHFADEETLRHALRAELERTVGAQLPPSGTVSASLSGGIDSSLVVALAQRACGQVSTFSITFGKEYRDELPFSSLVAEHCGTSHTVVELTPETILAHLDDTIACLDKPNGDPLTVPNALLFRTMSDTSPVALNGEGGDPCFGGPKNLPMLLSSLYDTPAHDGDSERTLERAYLRAHLKAFDELSDLLHKDVFAAACTPPLEHDLVPWFTDPRWRGMVSRLMAINTRFKGAHHILPKVAALAAPFGVRPRSPLFAKALVSLAFSIPPELKLRGSEEKYLLKRSVADVLPASILERPKSGMMVPVEGWFSGPLLGEARARILEGLGPLQLFQRAYLERLLDGRLGGLRPRRGVKIWLLITLEAHLRALSLRMR